MIKNKHQCVWNPKHIDLSLYSRKCIHNRERTCRFSKGKKDATKESGQDTKGKHSFGEDEVMLKMVKHSNVKLSFLMCEKYALPQASCLFPGLSLAFLNCPPGSVFKVCQCAPWNLEWPRLTCEYVSCIICVSMWPILTGSSSSYLVVSYPPHTPYKTTILEAPNNCLLILCQSKLCYWGIVLTFIVPGRKISWDHTMQTFNSPILLL